MEPPLIMEWPLGNLLTSSQKKKKGGWSISYNTTWFYINDNDFHIADASLQLCQWIVKKLCCLVIQSLTQTWPGMELQFHVISVWKVSTIDMHRLSGRTELALRGNNKKAERKHAAGGRTHDSERVLRLQLKFVIVMLRVQFSFTCPAPTCPLGRRPVQPKPSPLIRRNRSFHSRL